MKVPDMPHGYMGFLRRRPKTQAEKHYEQALRCRRRKSRDFNFGLAVWRLRQAIELEPANPLFYHELGRAFAALPLLAVVRGVDGFTPGESAQRAIAASKEALRLKPDFADAYLVLGEAYMYLGETEKALRAFDAVLDVSDNQRLRAYAERERQQAEHGISKEPQPEKALGHLERAVAYRDRNDHRRAERELGKAIKVAPDWSWLYDSLCRLGSKHMSGSL